MSPDQIRDVIYQVSCPPFGFVTSELDGIVYLQAKVWRVDVYSQYEGYGYGGVQAITSDMTEDAIVKRCFVAARDYAEHEVRENFLWKGRRVFDPHQPLQNLWEISREG
jgi:hypothetical protein